MKTLLLVAIVLAGVAGFAIRASGATPVGVAAGQGPLTKDEFWTLIDHSAAFARDPDAQLADLNASLSRQSASRIADFERLFDDTMHQSYSWDLWGAAYLINGGASDDGFEYFRCWLISRGRAFFDKAVADPDSLADLLPPDDRGDHDFEEFAYVARRAWHARTGRDWNAMPVIANMSERDNPRGKPFSEDPADLARRYPRLWKRFGQR